VESVMLREAIKTKQCTRCFDCCYTALDVGFVLKTEFYPIDWAYIPVYDDVYENVAMCNFAIIDNLQPTCFNSR